MKNSIALLIIIFLLVKDISLCHAQTTGQPDSVSSTSSNLIAQPIPDRTVTFNISDTGEHKPIYWGLDLAWLSEANIKRGIAFMGADRVDLVRSSFTPTDSLVNGNLQADELSILNERLSIIDLFGSNMNIVLNCDHPSVHPWYAGNAERWAQLIDETARLHEEKGHTIVTVSPFNEPDYSATGQGTISDFYDIAGELKKNPRFDSVRISGGNTLNADEAFTWYNTLKDRLDEGNTHQLAGSFDNYASFYERVRANGDHATNDELHNVMEAMVGVEYGLQTGIWWGTAEYARGEFVKASDGKRLGYAEHRPNWTAASVYRNPEGKVQAFAGTSERQAITTTYRFISTDRAVYFDGQGPQHEYVLEMPGGTGYEQGQSNAERVVNITWGDDIQPVINGRYLLINRNSRKVMEVADGSPSRGANLQQGNNNGATYQQWNVTPVSPKVGGDFSYFKFTAVHSGKAPDILNWSLDNGGNVIVWDAANGTNQQWYLEYAGDGWFYIRSRYSAKCLEVANASNVAGANIQQWDVDGGTNQQWRFLPVGTTVDFNSPGAPSNLVASANAESIRLDWQASPDADVSGYTIFRSNSAGGPYNTIARNVKPTAFVDNTANTGAPCFYAVKAVDSSMNSSAYSNEVSATATGSDDIVVHYPFEGNTLDTTINLNHCALYGEGSFIEGKTGSGALSLNGDDAFAQLPPNLANQQEISVAAWVYWNGGAYWQHIFDFGNSMTEYMFLSPNMRFALKNGGAEQRLDAQRLPEKEWAHVAVTLGDSGTCMYLNGELIAETDNITIRPLDFKPVLNYIGRGQLNIPLFDGYVDDFRVYNYALSADEVAQIHTPKIIPSGFAETELYTSGILSVWPIPAKEVVSVKYTTENIGTSSTLAVYNTNGNLVMSKMLKNGNTEELDVSDLPTGIYMTRLTNSEESLVQRLMIRH